MSEHLQVSDTARRPFRICVIGVECSGKTTLAEALSATLNAPLVHEVSRDYFADKIALGDPSVYAADIARVSQAQARREDDTAASAARFVVLDTDVFTLALWSPRYLGRPYPDLEQLAEERQRAESRIDLYLLVSPEIPFVHDGVRGSAAERDHMHEIFRARLLETGRRFVEVSGDERARLETALVAVLDAVSEE